ncbi:hypothetical protein C6P46_003461 [Rhodotorula mucilaginosa]|uniref:Uncharacterized protein n=1 Tax=Rhodotorula mucilaginosa TaxID=5537 RepID=A0A9P6W2Y7_RHOMI|nr:hypothetical protein C6P46_003461 [Rhodotorula mucilaginosa]TKA57218.1 hypothetical protein B0A53_01174 [Rhodotorula sp. CCFEE 5036]
MLPKRVPYRLVDAFTDKPFQGNPAAVVLFEDDRIDDDQLLQMLAIEYNLQETAFLRRLDAANNPGEAPRYRLRWFTPVQEFPLCGHATLASAHYLLSEVHPQAKRISFETMSGTLHTTRSPSGTLELDFPADTSVLAAPDRETVQSIQKRLEGVNAALSQEVVDVRVGKLAVIVELRTSYDLATAELDALPLASSKQYFVFTQVAAASSGSNIYSRVLDGAEACPEDPVTGSAHCMLAPYYLETGSAANQRLREAHPILSTSDPVIRCQQGGPRRGSLEVEWRKDDGRVTLRGRAVTVMEGFLRV